MTEGERNPFLIAPPPGLVPAAVPVTPTEVERAAPVDLIGLPPGVVDAAPAPASQVATTPTPTVAPRAAPFSLTPPSTQPDSAPPTFSLELADGTRHPLDRSILIGRGPASRPDWPEARLLPVVDPDKSVSKTHAGIRVHGDELRVEDLRSTNGVTVAHHDGRSSIVESGIPVTVEAGDVVSLGQFAVRIVTD
jgi:hypothetical protein